MNEELRKVLMTISIICFIVIIIGSLVYLFVIDREGNLEKFYEIYDKCDYFIIMDYSFSTTSDICYTPYAYLRMKEDGREGNYCFVSPKHDRIYGSKVCNSEINSVRETGENGK